MPLALAFVVLAFLLLLAALPFVAFIAMLLVAIAVRWRRGDGGTGRADSRFVVVIPAHNEETSIGATIRSLKELDYPVDRLAILIVADNCSDRTASVARSEDVTVWERQDDQKRAKGYALEYAFGRLAKETAMDWDAAVVIDADTRVDRGLLRAFDRHLARGAQWLQAYYSVSNPDVSWRTRLLTLALSLFNGIWLLGCDRLGLSVPLRGNGMCFSRAALARHAWRAYGLAEDLEFSWWLRIWGERVRFVADSAVYGEMAISLRQGALPQRQRWEEGRRQLRVLFGLRLLRSRVIHPLRKAAYAIDLFMPPLARLSLWIGGAVLALFLAQVLGTAPASWLLYGFLSALAMVFILLVYLVSPLLVWRLAPRHFFAILYFPVYVFWKVILFFQKKPTGWVRTPRAGE